MTDSTYTHLAIVADRSGSMTLIADDMNGGLDSFLREQKDEPGTLLVDVTVFDSKVERPYVNASPEKVLSGGPIIQPRGMTALLDGVGKTIVGLGEHFASLDEDKRPGKVIVLVVTDGEENSSVEWKLGPLADLVKKHQTEFSWEFIFLGANIDSFSTGGGIGFSKGATMNYAPTASGVSAVLRSASAYVTSTRSGLRAEFSDEDRAAAEDNS
jgi:hypothetical protein